MITLLINLVVIAILCGLAYWIIGLLPLPPVVKQVVTVAMVVIVCIAVIYLLLGVVGGGAHGVLLQ